MADPSDNRDNKRVSDQIFNNGVSNHENEVDNEVNSTCSDSVTEQNSERNSSSGNHSSASHFLGLASGSSSKRQETNPYSFKHFLTGEKPNAGVRPRHHTNSRGISEPSENEGMDLPRDLSCSRSNRSILNNPDLASGLPDFVQDHLIMEQCFLEPSSSNPSNTSYNLEESHIYQLENAIFEQSRSAEDRSANANDIPFDLTSTTPNQRRERDALSSVPLDLPSFHSTNPRSGRPRDPPLDLPSSSINGPGACGVNSSEVGTSKSLPDFLSDGPIHQRRSDELEETDGQNLPFPPHELSPSERRLSISQLQAENVQLRREVESLSTLLAESNNRLLGREARHRAVAELLEKELNSTRDNLRRTMERAIVAEASVHQLKQEIKSSTTLLHSATGSEQSSTNCNNEGDGDRTAVASSQDPNQRLGSEIRNIASSAEVSLRQLLNDVETLRLIATSLEDSTKDSRNQESSSKDSNNEESKKT